MGITDHLLKSVQEQREGKKLNGHCEEPNDSSLRGTVGAEAISKRLIIPSLILIILLSIFFNITLFVITSNNSKKSGNIIAKIEEIKKAVNNNNIVFKEKIFQIDSKINELENNQNTQTFAIENLKKAKDNIFSRVTKLESENEVANNAP